MAQFQIVRKEAQRVVCFEFWSEWSECAPMVPQVQSMIPPNPPTQMSPAVPPSPARPTVPSPSLVRPFFLLRRSKIQHFSRDPAAIRWIVPSSPRSGLERPAGARYGPPSQPTAHSLEKVVEFFSQLGSSRSQLQLYVVPESRASTAALGRAFLATRNSHQWPGVAVGPTSYPCQWFG
jgi:hypothetical protein